jgi:hypothetical protein
MPAVDEPVSIGDESTSPLAASKEFIFEQRARDLSYETIAGMLREREVQTSPSAVGRFCRKHLTDEELLRRRAELKGSLPAGATALPPGRSQVVEMEALFSAAKLELETLLERQLNGVNAATASIERSREQLAELKQVIHERPAVVARLFDAEMQASAVKVLTKVKELESTLNALLVATRGTLQWAERRLLFAAWVIGVGVGAMGCWLVLP